MVPVLLEALSGLEDARLNYVEQVGMGGGGCSDPAGTHVWVLEGQLVVVL